MINIIICYDYSEPNLYKNLLNSIKAHTKEDINFLIYAPDKDPIPNINDFHNSIVKSKSMFWRFLLPEIFKEIDKYIYLEIDSIVEDDIKNLWNFNLINKTVGMVRDQFEFKIKDTIRFQGDVSRNEMFMYYNTDIDIQDSFLSGQMIVNADKWRRLKFTQRLIEFIEKYKTADMIAINCVLNNEIKILPDKWSAPAKWLNDDYKLVHDRLNIPKDYINSSLYHFHGKPKPWEKEANYPLIKLWKKYD